MMFTEPLARPTSVMPLAGIDLMLLALERLKG